MNDLKATYRVQLHRDFNLKQLEEILPYLQELGISTIYASPIFEAQPGSTHGYDTFDPNRIASDIATEEELRAFSEKLKAAGIQWLQDIVPNHMSFDPRNPWLADVLRKGPGSHYAPFFDIDWNNPATGNRLMAPFIGSTSEQAIKDGNLKLDLHDDRLVFRYYETFWPVRDETYVAVLGDEYANGKIPPGDAEAIKQRIEEVNKDTARLLKIESEQHYRLCAWNETDSHINYRRFFIVNALICLNIHEKSVMQEHHKLVFQLIKDGLIQGLRIDHIDGLYNPELYLHQLRAAVGKDTAIVVEKILEPGEDLPTSWPVQGTTGYDFLALVNNLLTHTPAEEHLTKFYHDLSEEQEEFEERVAQKKSLILSKHMQGELDNLLRLFLSLQLTHDQTTDSIQQEDLREAIGAFLVYCPVYRFYGYRFPLSTDESKSVKETLDKARHARPELEKPLDLLEDLFLHQPSVADEEWRTRITKFYSRCMQFSGPLMAKGVEDTLMYTDHRFIAHNEVGDSPGTFGETVHGFHQSMKVRQSQWPYTLNATATHDTKRGEDVRARLQVLTDRCGEWLKTVGDWRRINKELKKEKLPHGVDEYFIYQTLVGTYPMPGQQDEQLPQRLDAYLEKALREGKARSSWAEPDENYEQAAKSFTAALLQPDTPFQRSFQGFLSTIADHGIINTLVQVLLKFTCPGMPDVYQGSELWDLSLVDPDNRRPVNFEDRKRLLEEVKTSDIKTLWESRYSGGIKLWLVQLLFGLRRNYPALFSCGEYIPLEVEGEHKEHIVAFARRHGSDMFIVAAALHTALLADDPMQIDWKDTAILLPEKGATVWLNCFRDDRQPQDKKLFARTLLAGLPLVVLHGHRAANQRKAGILFPITSLPSYYGIGDMGPEAEAFAQSLHRSGQSYWQILPLNPISREQSFSPYSSISSRAGNSLLISPERMVEEGFISAESLEGKEITNDGRTDYEAVETLRASLFNEAWAVWQVSGDAVLRSLFEQFVEEEKSWLDDYALYVALKEERQGQPWYEWEEGLRWRDEKALEEARQKHGARMDKIKWIQFIFTRQWMELKKKVNALNIRFIGDLPFYVSHDSADVWSHPRFFALDAAGQMTGVSGVPPDAFSEDGQLWGMPTFNWEAIREDHYAWWIDRLRRNVTLFDMVRLDHFRALASFWEVVAGDQNARHGQWKQGPGAPFFEAVQEALGGLPFLAEDLGEIDEAVYQLRDQFGLPGMKVLQFAFDGDSPHSVHAPHNYSPEFFAYTGTHDNNTSRGWFTCDADDATRAELEAYVGRPVSVAEVSQVMSRLVVGSVAHTAILPLQDVLNLDERSRVNRPSSTQDNWSWRLLPGQLTSLAEELLLKWTKLYGRE